MALTNGEELKVQSPTEMPDRARIAEIRELRGADGAACVRRNASIPQVRERLAPYLPG